MATKTLDISLAANVIENVAKSITSRLFPEFKAKLRLQGHHLTGALEKSIHYRVRENIIKIYALDYGEALNTGVPASNVPYSEPGRAPESKYIQGLIDFFKHPKRGGLDEKEALSAAIATARVAKGFPKPRKGEGHPTKGSSKYSSDGGKRTGWIDDVMKDNEQLITFEVQRFFSEVVITQK